MIIMNYKFSFLFIFLMLLTNIYGQTPVAGQKNNSKKEAGRLWELAIEAKGGREKLNQINNIQNSSHGSYREEFLIVYPGKAWDWQDNRPSVLGLSMSMHNLETSKKYFLAGDNPSNFKMEKFDINTPIDSGVFSASIWITLENKWLRPVPESVTTDRIGFQKVDVVQTRLNGKRFDFALNRKTHLPVKVSYYLHNYQGEGEHIAWELKLSDYVDYQGIKVPRLVDGQKNTYQFNVEYNEDIFTTPPLPIESAADAWKKKN